jgi:hypothetical protein
LHGTLSLHGFGLLPLLVALRVRSDGLRIDTRRKTTAMETHPMPTPEAGRVRLSLLIHHRTGTY